MRTFVTVVGLLCALHGAAHAQLQVFVWPVKLELAVPAGQAESRKLKVVNTGTNAVMVHPYTADWWYTADEVKRFAPAGTYPRSSASWVAFDPAPFKLDAGASRVFDITMSVPAGAKGGHYTVLFFELRPAPDPDKGVSVRFGGRMGVLLAQYDPRTSKPRLVIDRASVEPPTDVDPLRVTMAIHNPGDVHVTPTGTATVVSKKDGRMIGHFPLKGRWGWHLPGQAGEVVGEWPSKLPSGAYEVLSTISYFGSKTLVQRTPLVVP